MCKPHRRTITGRGSKAGYTLTEMLVVIAVIGLIAAFLTPNLLAQLGRAKSKTAQLQLNGIAGALTLGRIAGESAAAGKQSEPKQFKLRGEALPSMLATRIALVHLPGEK